jgi:hypothetical protein
MEPTYGDIQHINVNGELYQIRSANELGETYFIVFRSGEVLCTLRKNKNGRWQPSCDIGDHLLSGFVTRISKLYK